MYLRIGRQCKIKQNDVKDTGASTHCFLDKIEKKLLKGIPY